MEIRIGTIPLPVHLLLLTILGYFVASGKVPTEHSMMIAVLAVLGFTCAELGRHVPLLKQIGGAAIFAAFIPSYLAFHQLIPPVMTKAVTDFTKASNFLCSSPPSSSAASSAWIAASSQRISETVRAQCMRGRKPYAMSWRHAFQTPQAFSTPLHPELPGAIHRMQTKCWARYRHRLMLAAMSGCAASAGRTEAFPLPV